MLLDKGNSKVKSRFFWSQRPLNDEYIQGLLLISINAAAETLKGDTRWCCLNDDDDDFNDASDVVTS